MLSESLVLLHQGALAEGRERLRGSLLLLPADPEVQRLVAVLGEEDTDD